MNEEEQNEIGKIVGLNNLVTLCLLRALLNQPNINREQLLADIRKESKELTEDIDDLIDSLLRAV